MTALWRVGDLDVDLDARSVTRAGTPLDLRGLTFDLLCALIDGQGELVTFETLINKVWDGGQITNEVITQRVRLLRRALGDDPATPRYVKTVRQKGYLLCASVVPAAAATRLRIRWRWLLIVAVLVAAVAFFVSSRSPSVDPLLERARYYARTGQSEDNLRAIDLYEQMLVLDPQSFGAALGLSFALSQRVCRHDDQPELLERARALVVDLKQRAPDDADVLAALAYVDDCTGQIDLALEGYLSAHRVDATHMDSLASAAHLMQVRGQLADALDANLRVEAQTREAPYRYTDIQIARCLELMTFERAARARYLRTVQLYPDNLFAASAYVRFLLGRGEFEAARAAASRSVRLGAVSADLLALRGELELLGGQIDAARESFAAAAQATRTASWSQTLLDIYAQPAAPVETLTRRVATIRAYVAGGDRWPDNQIELAVLLLHLDDPDAAFTALDDAIALGFRDIAYLEASPLFERLRGDERFATVARRIREAAASERDSALAASWWRPDIIAPAAP